MADRRRAPGRLRLAQLHRNAVVPKTLPAEPSGRPRPRPGKFARFRCANFALAPLFETVVLGAVLCGLAIGGEARADAARGMAARVGLVVATRVNLSEAEADSLAFRLGEALREELEVDVIAGAEVRRRLPPAGIADDCVARPACVRDVATRLDGDELLFLFVARIGPRVQIDVTWVEPRRGAVTSRPAIVIDERSGGDRSIDRAFAAAPRALLPNAARRTARAALVGGPIGASAAPTAVSPSARSSADMPVPDAGDDLRRRGRRITAPVVVAGVVAAAALATGVGFAVAARQDYQSLEDDDCDRAVCSDEDARIDRMERKALVADILFAGAGAAALTGLVLYFTSADSEPRIRVAAGDRAGFVSFTGSF